MEYFICMGAGLILGMGLGAVLYRLGFERGYIGGEFNDLIREMKIAASTGIEIVREGNCDKLRKLDGYKLSLATKILADAAQMLENYKK